MLIASESVSLAKPPTSQPIAQPGRLTRPAVRPAHAVMDETSDSQGLRRVALIIETSGSYGRGLLQGIAKYNREHGNWSTYFRPQGMNEPPPKWLSRWKGDGMLVRIQSPEAIDSIKRADIPVVNLRGTTASLPVPFVSIDHKQIVEMALEHLRGRGLRRFAFCGRLHSNNPALKARAEEFRKQVEHDGGTCFVYPEANHQNGHGTWDDEQDRLANWILKLPKPIGVMACNDERGLEVLDACRRCGAAVPDDVAVVGVDNDQAICDLAIPPLSSVDVNAEAIGYEAAALLERMMNGERAPSKPLLIAPRGVVTRRSTDLAASEDEEVARALRYIREHACRRLQVMDVLAYMAMSRASLQQRMRQVVGRTIHQEIQRVRLERVKQLLTMSDLTIKQVARESGFASVQYMTRVFRALTRETPARYRLRRAM